MSDREQVGNVMDLIGKMLDEKLKAHNDGLMQAIMLILPEIKSIDNKVDTVIHACQNKSKSAPRAPKQDAEGVKESIESGSIVKDSVKSTPRAKPIDGYFKEKWVETNNAAFRAKYGVADILAEINNLEDVKKKREGTTKDRTIATKLYTKLKSLEGPLYNDLRAEYEQYKKEQKAPKNKVQEEMEPPSP
jgi:hypothetical protein